MICNYKVSFRFILKYTLIYVYEYIANNNSLYNNIKNLTPFYNKII